MIGLACALLLAGHPARAAGAAGGEFLSIAASTRAAGMGEAFGAVAEGAGALTHNPAGLARSRDLSFHYLHAFWLDSIGYDHLAAVAPMGKTGAGGLSFTRIAATADRFGVGAGGEPVPLGTFDASESGITVGYGWQFDPTLSVGGALKLVNQDVAVASASAVAADLGMMYRTPLPALTAALAIHNAGARLEEASLPTTIRLGAAWSMTPLPSIASFGREGRLDTPLFALDALFPLASGGGGFMRLRFGAEYTIGVRPGQNAAVRLGYRWGEEDPGGLAGATAGLGWDAIFGRVKVGVDWAFGHYGDLGVTHRIAFTTSFRRVAVISFVAPADPGKAASKEGLVFLQWPPASDATVTGYNVYMGTSQDADFIKVNRSGGLGVTSLTVRGLVIGKTYYFFVTPILGVEPAIEGRAFYETKAAAVPAP